MITLQISLGKVKRNTGSASTEALPEYVDIPSRLRIGLARGHAYSVGNGNDYVGACINVAARLQKFGATVAAKRGIVLAESQIKNVYTKRVEIRGIGSDELVYIHKSDFDGLSQEEQALFYDP